MEFEVWHATEEADSASSSTAKGEEDVVAEKLTRAAKMRFLDESVCARHYDVRSPSSECSVVLFWADMPPVVYMDRDP